MQALLKIIAFSLVGTDLKILTHIITAFAI